MREHLRDLADPLCAPLAEQQTLADADVLRVAHEAEHDRGSVVGVYAAASHDALDHRCLADAADVHGSLEASVDCRRVEQDADRRLQLKYKPSVR